MGRQKRMPGLRKRGDVWHIQKTIKGFPGGTFHESTGETDRDKAEEYATKRIEEIRRSIRFGERPTRTFSQAARYYVETSEKRSLRRDVQSLRQVLPYIGHLPIEMVHMGTLASYINEYRPRQAAGTINRTLCVVRRILMLAARLWRHENNLTWLETPPLIQLLEGTKRNGHPLTYEEEQRFFPELPEHLQLIAIFLVHTGLRDEELRSLRWSWLRERNGVTFFNLPDWLTKNGKSRPAVVNRAGQAVLDRVRGRHEKRVFTYWDRKKGLWVPYETRLLNSAWKRARVSAGLPDVTVHDMRRTCATRLRDCGVSDELRRDILGHQPDRNDMARLYALPTLRAMDEALQLLCDNRSALAAVKSA